MDTATDANEYAQLERADLIEALEHEREISRVCEAAAEEMAIRLDRASEHLRVLAKYLREGTADPWPDKAETEPVTAKRAGRKRNA